MPSSTGAKAVICASTGNTSASAAAYAAHAGITAAVLVPEGKIAMGKLSQAVIHNGQLIQIRGNLDDCLEIARELADHYPVHLVDSVNPDRIEARRPPRPRWSTLGAHPIPLIPVGNAATHGLFARIPRRSARGVATRVPRMFGFQAEGSAPLVRGEVVKNPETIASAIRIGNPASWDLALEARDATDGWFGAIDDARILKAQKLLASTAGVFVEPASAISVAGLLDRVRSRRHSCGLESRPHRHRPRPERPAVGAARRRRIGRRAARGRCDDERSGIRARSGAGVCRVTGAGRTIAVQVPATSANLGPGFDTLGLALSVYDELVVTALPEGELEIVVSGEGAADVPTDATHLVVRAMAYAFEACGRTMPGLRLEATNVIPHGRGLGSSGAAVVAGLLAAKGLLEGDVELGAETLLRLATELEGHPDNVAPALFGGLTIAWMDENGPQHEAARAPRCLSGGLRTGVHHVDERRARAGPAAGDP